MAGVLSFAHLKSQAKNSKKPTPNSGESEEFYRTETGHLLPAENVKKMTHDGVEIYESPASESPGDFNFVAPVERVVVDARQQRTTYRIPSIAETATLAKTNFCAGCPRFCRAGDEHRYDLPGSQYGYGWCWRSGKGGGTEWRDIPVNATVSRCVFLIKSDGGADGK